MSSSPPVRDLQLRVDEFIKKHGGYWSPLSMLAALIEEVGELAKEINLMEISKSGKSELSHNIAIELGDVFFALICIANYFNVDLALSLNLTINKYVSRDYNSTKP